MNKERKRISGLVHKYAWATNDIKFFEHIDAHGGWPIGYKYVGFEHTDERAAGFTNSPTNSEWWTIVASSDDYYLWKLSPEVLQNIVDAAISATRLQAPDVSSLWVKTNTRLKKLIKETK